MNPLGYQCHPNMPRNHQTTRQQQAVPMRMVIPLTAVKYHVLKWHMAFASIVEEMRSWRFTGKTWKKIIRRDPETNGRSTGGGWTRIFWGICCIFVWPETGGGHDSTLKFTISLICCSRLMFDFCWPLDGKSQINNHYFGTCVLARNHQLVSRNLWAKSIDHIPDLAYCIILVEYGKPSKHGYYICMYIIREV